MQNKITTQAQGVHSLGALKSLTAAATGRLHAQWITSVEEVVAAAATPAGADGLARLLEPEHVTVDSILAEARQIIGDDVFNRLCQPHPGGCLGARLSFEQEVAAPFNRVETAKEEDPTKGPHT